MSRYDRRPIAINEEELYKRHFEERDIKRIEQYITPRLIYPTDEQAEIISFITHIWSGGDKYYLIAQRYYNDPKLWWIIAQFNQAPTEQHLTEGQAIKIPYPLSSAYAYLRQE